MKRATARQQQDNSNSGIAAHDGCSEMNPMMIICYGTGDIYGHRGGDNAVIQ
jgi:hypothetical protein